MSSASDKARYHVEHTVTELREWERRELFTKSELGSIAAQRTHHETLLASRDATPALCLRYIEHERNLAALLSARLTRKRLAGRTAQKLQTKRTQHLFSVHERATRRFHGALPLWAAYLRYCQDQGAARRVQRVLAETCRLFATNPDVWTWAAEWAEQRGDVQAARGYWLRGCRFCLRDWALRVAFARAEMRWVARARKTLGITGANTQQNGDVKEIEGNVEDEEKDADLIALPTTTPHEDNPDSGQGEEFQQFSSTPAMSGAIPIAIFDAAMKASDYSDDAIDAFFAMFASFAAEPCTPRILDHVLDTLTNSRPASAALQSSRCRRPLVGLQPDSAAFADALRTALAQIKTATSATDDPAALAGRLLAWMKPLAEDERLIGELRQVVRASVRRLEKAALQGAG